MRSNNKLKKTQETMKMTKFYAPFAALLLAGAAFTSCSSDDAKSEVVPANKNWSLSIDGVAPSLDTRMLNYNGVNQSVSSIWALGETMEVYNITQGATFRGLLTPKNGGAIQDFLVTTPAGLTGSFALNDVLKIYYPKKNVSYEGQNGIFEEISDNYDYSSVSVTITDIDETNKALKATSAKGAFAAQFVNLQALVKFNFTVEGEPLRVSYVNVSGEDNNHQAALVQKMDPQNDQAILGDIDINLPVGEETDQVWAAIRANANVTLTLTVQDTHGISWRAVTATPIQFQNGMFYEINVPLQPVEEEYGTGSN